MSIMTIRIAILGGAALALAACGSKSSLEQAESEAAEDAALGGKIECALAGSTTFERNCTTETVSGDEARILVVRHPDGGFRRFNILTDGRGLAPADGFDETKVKLLSDGMIEVTSGDDSYRLPAAIKARSGSKS